MKLKNENTKVFSNGKRLLNRESERIEVEDGLYPSNKGVFLKVKSNKIHSENSWAMIDNYKYVTYFYRIAFFNVKTIDFND